MFGAQLEVQIDMAHDHRPSRKLYLATQVGQQHDALQDDIYLGTFNLHDYPAGS